VIGRLQLERADRAGHASEIGGRSFCRWARAGAVCFERRVAVRRRDGAKNGSCLAVKASQPPGRSQQGPCRLSESAGRLSRVGCGLPLADCVASMLRPSFSPCATNYGDARCCASASHLQRQAPETHAEYNGRIARPRRVSHYRGRRAWSERRSNQPLRDGVRQSADDMTSRVHLILNRSFATVRCLACGKVLISRGVHDYRVCGCPQETTVDGGLAYLRCGGAHMSLVGILVDPEWPRTVRLELLQEAAALAMRLGCKFEPPGDVTDGAVAAVVLRLRDCVATAEATCEVLINTGLWPPVPPSEPPIEMVRPISG
jgi:hypothetical protein